MIFKKLIIYWYSNNKRNLPWRLSQNPYTIWLSEIILQQTKVKQGLPFFNKFITKYPTIEYLAAAKEDEVLKLWQGLGYYSRARNLLTTAKYIFNNLNGVFPNKYQNLLKLKGIGPYTAAAIASICYQEPVAVVDGNVYRVLSRYFNSKTPINSPSGIKEFKSLAQQMIDTKKPDEYNQAIMELGALICTPSSPNCNECPVNGSCLALQKKTTDKLPVKIKKHPVKKRYFNYLVTVTNSDNCILNKRTKKDIWFNLYEFPLIETNKSISKETLIELDLYKDLFKPTDKYTLKSFNSIDIVSKLTHQHIYTKFWIINIKSHPLAKTKFSDFSKFAVPVHIHKFITAFKNLN